MAQRELRFSRVISITKKVDLPYLLHVPESASDSAAKWPLILFLHGRDQRGDDVELLKIRGIPKIAEENRDFPFIVLAPKCPSYYIWPFVFDGVMALVDEVAQQYPVDPRRIFVTGLSMGAMPHGTWPWNIPTSLPALFR